MPRKKPLPSMTEAECKRKLGETVEVLIEDKLNNFRTQTCAPRIAMTNHIQKEINDLHISIKDIKHIINTVSANGNKGLEASLKDLYTKNTEVHDAISKLSEQVTAVLTATESSRAWTEWFTATKSIFRKSKFLSLFRSKVGRILTLLLLFLLLNSLLHSIGITLDIQDMVKYVLRIITG